tara:strand:- start:299 stop:559 length:261 start_codon:yes stop_codon:yes gene_type:complete
MEEFEEPQFMAVDSNSDEYQRTIDMAQETLGQFKAGLELLSDDDYACVKFFIPESPESEEGAYGKFPSIKALVGSVVPTWLIQSVR